MEDGTQTRIDKIYGIIEQCRFGVHDISRTELDDASGLPRFNMPLELGIFLGAKRFGSTAQKTKRCLVLDTDRYRYQKFISDIAGTDIKAHGGDVDRALRQVRDWLTNASRRKLPGHIIILDLWREFARDLPALAAAAGLDPDDLPYADFESLVVGWLTR